MIMKDEIRQLLDRLKLDWDTIKNAKNSWFSNTTSRFSVVAPFFYKSLDELMVLMDKYTMPGIGKKSIVMEAITELYDYVVAPLIPIYIKPFSSAIRTLVLDVLISHLVNFIVAKVRSVVPKPEIV